MGCFTESILTDWAGSIWLEEKTASFFFLTCFIWYYFLKIMTSLVIDDSNLFMGNDIFTESVLSFIKTVRKNNKTVSIFPLKPCLREFLVFSRFLGATLYNVWRGCCMPNNVLRGCCMKKILFTSYFGTVWFTKRFTNYHSEVRFKLSQGYLWNQHMLWR